MNLFTVKLKIIILFLKQVTFLSFKINKNMSLKYEKAFVDVFPFFSSFVDWDILFFFMFRDRNFVCILLT